MVYGIRHLCICSLLAFLKNKACCVSVCIPTMNYRMAQPIYIKPGTCIAQPESISKARFINPTHQYCQYYSLWYFRNQTLILLECQYQSSKTFVCVSRHMKPSQRCTSYIPSNNSTNIIASQIVVIINVMLLKSQIQTPWNLVCTTWHLIQF